MLAYKKAKRVSRLDFPVVLVIPAILVIPELIYQLPCHTGSGQLQAATIEIPVGL